MAEIQRAWCDDCRRPVDVVGSIGLCIACYMVPLFVNVITRETELGEREAFNLTKALIVPMFNALVQRLQVPGQEHPLALELLQSIAGLQPPNTPAQ